MKRVGWAIIILIITSMAYADNTPPCKLNIRAQVEVTAKADRAVFSFTIEGTGQTLRLAVEDAKNKVGTITGRLMQLGLTEKNLSTSNFYTDESIGKKAIILSKKEYKTNITVTVSLDDMSKLEEAILIVSDAQPDYLSGVDFVLHNIEELKMTATEKAIKKAKQKAGLVAEIMGVELGELVSFNENTNIGDYQRYKGSRDFSPFNASIDIADNTASGGSIFFSPDRKIVSSVEAVIAIKAGSIVKSDKESLSEE
jgi:uncharacterized protein